jgi:predicted AAA+ superfamily ATPase
MKPWREIAIPHPDVLKGTFQQAEFAADITAVRIGKAPAIYQDAAAFFERTYITEGMRLLLTQVAQRLSGKGGEPVIQLQTAFGGGKTHTMLAVWHLATRKCPLSDMPGVAPLVEKAGLMEVPQARVAVVDGTAQSPGQTWKQGRTEIRTLWGELAWQLGQADGYAMVAQADANGTSPGKEVLQRLLETYAPCVVLIDELVAYIGQFEEGKQISGGSFESNMAFIQALTEAVKLVPNAILLASLPESEIEAGSQRGVMALKALEKRFGRVQALWRPVATEEAFEIVRRRLFEPIKDEKTRDAVCRAFADMYVAEGSTMPGETQEARYYGRLRQAYPIHPEFFDRLYEDWTTIDGFQRTRGVLKLMAKVISRLWKANNTDLMILPGSLPLSDNDVRNEMTYLLTAGWEPVIERDVDGDRAETTELEGREPRFGQANAARRVARTIFLGSAPSSVAAKPTTRGLDRARVLLGCLQPGQASAVFSDALARISDRLHYLNSTGDKSADNTRYWFDTRANLRREMEDRKRRFDDRGEVRQRIEEVAKKLFVGATILDGVHVFTPAADIPDDSSLRLVLLPPDNGYMKEMRQPVEDAVRDYLRSHGTQPRHRANRLLFVAPDSGVISRLTDAVRTALAWDSIVDDVDSGKLNIDQVQKKQAQKELESAEGSLPRVARECFKWLLCPVQEDPTATKPTIEAFPISTSGSSAGVELEKVCSDNELVIEAWSPIHLRSCLKDLYWKNGKDAVEAKQFWEDSLRYLYLPRLRNRPVLENVIRKGAATRDFFGTAYGKTGTKYEGFQLGLGGASFDDTLLLIEPAAAVAYEEATKVISPVVDGSSLVTTAAPAVSNGNPTHTKSPALPSATATAPAKKSRIYHGAIGVTATLAKSQLNTIAEEVIALLASDPNAIVNITLEIAAEYDRGVEDGLKRSVSENADSLGFRTNEWA